MKNPMEIIYGYTIIKDSEGHKRKVLIEIEKRKRGRPKKQNLRLEMLRCPRCWKKLSKTNKGKIKYMLCHECMEELP